MAKLQAFDMPGLGTRYLFWCPGCRSHHSFDVRTDGGRPSWQFNGDIEWPTFTPSLLYPFQWRHDPENDRLVKDRSKVCHLFLTAGKIQYLGDCTHDHAGKTVDLPDLD